MGKASKVEDSSRKRLGSEDKASFQSEKLCKTTELRKNGSSRASVQPSKVAAKPLGGKDGDSSRCLNQIKARGMPVRMDAKRVSHENRHWADLIDKL